MSADLQEREFDVLTRSSNDIILLLSRDGQIVDANDRAVASYGYTREELIGRHASLIRAPETLKDLEEKIAQVVERGGMRFETVHIRKDGHRFPVESSARVIEIGGTKYVQSIVRDITDRKKGEDRLTRLNECFLAFGSDPVQNVNSLVALCGELLGAATALYNRLEGGMLCSIGQWNTPDDFRPEDKPEGHLCYDLIRSGNEDLMVVRNLPDTRYYRSDPNVKRYDLKTYLGKGVRFGQENIGSLCAVFQTDYAPSADDEHLMSLLAAAIGVEETRRHNEAALRESEERYRKLVEFSPDAIAVHSAGKLVFVNQAGIRLIGAKELKELVGKPLLDVVHPDYRELARMRALRSFEKQTDQPFVEEKFVRLDGSAVDVEVGTTPISYQGKPATLVVVRDLQDRKQAQEELVRLRKAAESSGEIIFTTDSEGIITFVNPEFTKVYGYDPEEVIGKVTPRILKSGLLDESSYIEFWRGLLQRQVFKGELINKTKGGRRITV
jgi:PAS domain S-box-containing protein